MLSTIFSCSFSGLQCQIIEVQGHISAGMPSFSIVGLGDASVQESKERVRSSIKNSGAQFPPTRKTINLAPAQARKQGTLFDLPIALSLLVAHGQLPKLSEDFIKQSVFVGELSLNGEIRPIHGALPIAQHAKDKGFRNIFLPPANVQEASFIDGINIYPIPNLKQVLAFLNSETDQLPYKGSARIHRKINHTQKFANIVGLENAKRALAIAAAGRHNVLLFGPPGCGKTIISRAIRHIMPPMTKNEILETTKIFSIAGLTTKEQPIIYQRPFREVHHTASASAIIGGGNNPRPGEISLAHNGVLFFDEIAEFPKAILETLRQPLEDKYININRSRYSTRFPCDFLFLATMNPCPCGHKTDPHKSCKCTQYQIKNYLKKLSGPLLDRFDIFLHVTKTNPANLLSKEKGLNNNSEIWTQILQAQNAQRNRGTINSSLSLAKTKRYCQPNQAASRLLSQATNSMNLSNRAYLKTVRLARTIADLQGEKKINENHVAEALQYRHSALNSCTF